MAFWIATVQSSVSLLVVGAWFLLLSPFLTPNWSNDDRTGPHSRPPSPKDSPVENVHVRSVHAVLVCIRSMVPSICGNCIKHGCIWFYNFTMICKNKNIKYIYIFKFYMRIKYIHGWYGIGHLQSYGFSIQNHKGRPKRIHYHCYQDCYHR